MLSTDNSAEGMVGAGTTIAKLSSSHVIRVFMRPASYEPFLFAFSWSLFVFTARLFKYHHEFVCVAPS